MIIFTDGSAAPNPGPGGFAVIIMNDEKTKVLDCYSEYKDNTTNNEMEMSAICWVMNKYGKEDNQITVYSDSSYAVNTFNNWMFSWANRGWIKSDNKIPENLRLVKFYYTMYENGYRIDLRHIRGHHGILGNELADKLATKKMTKMEVLEKYGDR